MYQDPEQDYLINLRITGRSVSSSFVTVPVMTSITAYTRPEAAMQITVIRRSEDVNIRTAFRQKYPVTPITAEHIRGLM